MPKKINSLTTREYLESAPLPTHANTYTVIGHKFVIDNTKKILAENGLEIETELYKCNGNAEIAQGVYYLKDSSDPELSMMFAWANSYDKTMRFKCSVGARVLSTGCTIIAGDVANWGRIHKGNADQDTIDTIKRQIKDAHRYFTEILADRDKMKEVMLTRETRAELIGILLADKEYLTLDQISIVCKGLKRPSFVVDGDSDSLWTFYNHILQAVQTSHPKNWLDRQRNIHWFLCRRYNVNQYEPIYQDGEVLMDPVVVERSESGEPLMSMSVQVIDFSLDAPVVSRQMDLETMISQVEEEKTKEAMSDQHELERSVAIEEMSQGLHTTDGVPEFFPEESTDKPEVEITNGPDIDFTL